ncbi:MAG: tetratricopeptide repeat protein, partial [Candidatus Eremiobacterota bacterium]
ERKDLLYGLFFLGTIISYIYYKETNRTIYYYISLMLFFLSLLSKPAGIILPFILLLFDYIISGETPDKKNIREKIPYILLTSIFIVITVTIMSFYKPSEGNTVYPFYHNIYIAAYNVIFYLCKLSWPAKQSAIYPHPGGTGLPLSFLISPFIVFIFITSIIMSLKYTKKIFFAMLFFLITILPVIQLIPVPPGIGADRYTYIPSLGYFYILSEGFVRIYRKKSNTRLKTLLTILLIIIIITLSSLSYKRTLVWKDSITLWSDVLKNYPDIVIAWNNRGIAYMEKNEYDRAIDDFDHSIKLDASYGEAYYNLGNTYYKKQEYDKALRNFNYALKLNNSHVKAYINRGTLYYNTGNYDLALSDINRALTLDPYSYIAYTARGNVYFEKKEYKKSLADYNQSLKIAPNFAETYNNRGILYGVIKEYDRAIDDFTKAVTINPLFIEAYYNRALTWSDKKEYEKAWEDIQKIQKLGYKADKQFVEKLRKELGK